MTTGGTATRAQEIPASCAAASPIPARQSNNGDLMGVLTVTLNDNQG
ncbi:MAG TPA: hypothetical protein VL101_08600 [Nordella sp.]|nr:hypothetical protein [Nordella sp.]